MNKREATGPGEESVWDYPRPPRIEISKKTIAVILDGKKIAKSNRAYRILETSHPPVYYIPIDDVDKTVLRRSLRTSHCEYKGKASYYDLISERGMIDGAAWYYPTPQKGFEAIKNHIAFYPGKVDKCTVDGETVVPQSGEFYGGWITKEIKGPFKGDPD